MDQKELLEKLEKDSQKRTICSFITAGCAVCVLLIVLIGAMQIVPKTVDAMEGLEAVSNDLEVVSKQLSDADIAGMLDQVNGLVSDSQKSVILAMEKLDAIDIDGMNAAIKDLHTVIEPLAKLNNFFSR